MTLLLVRHADAGDRAAWTGDDRARPLSATGREQALAIAERYAASPLERIVSSPARRCVDTVEPLASARDLPVETEEALAEGAPFDLVDRLLRRLADADVLLCSHGDIVQATITELRRRGVITGRPEWAKASTWVLDGWPTPARTDYVPPPGLG